MSDARRHADHDGPVDPDVELTVKGILYTAFGIIAVTAVSMVLMWMLGGSYRNAEEAARAPLTPLQQRSLDATRSANEAAGWTPPLPGLERNLDLPVPPGPPLELVEGYDMDLMRAEEDAQLNHYGYLDEETGRIHIPVDRAIEMAVERAAAQAAENPAATDEPAEEGTFAADAAEDAAGDVSDDDAPVAATEGQDG